MKLEQDIKLRDKVFELDHLPKEIRWTADKGWNEYKRKNYQKRSQMVLIWSSIAAILIFGIFLVYNEYRNYPRILQFRSEKGTRDILLNDGNKIYLNGSTSISIDLNEYKVEVNGEAYFDLLTQREFKISSPHGSYTAKKCSFNLRSRLEEERAILSVTDGEVIIKSDKDDNLDLIVESNNDANIIPRIAIVKAPLIDKNYLSWKTGKLHFENTPLYMVFNKLKELNETNIEVSNSEMKYCRISGDFNTISSNEVIQKILEIFNYKVVNSDSLILIQGKGCEKI